MSREHRAAEGKRSREVPGRAPAAQTRQRAARRKGKPDHRNAADAAAARAVEGENRHVRTGSSKAFGDLAGRSRKAARCRRVVPSEVGDPHQVASRRR